MQIEGKVALVTGGAQGLGYAFVQALLDKGAKVCFCDINTSQGEATLGELCEKYDKEKIMFRRCDVTSQEDMEALFKATKERYGRIDIVCNNAGMGGESYPQWEKVVDVNIKGMTRGTFIAVEYLRKDKGGNGGVIVNISSAAGKKGLSVRNLNSNNEDSFTHFEHMTCSVTIYDTQFRLCVIYRPPTSKRNGLRNKLFFDEWSSYLDQQVVAPRVLIIAGNLNFHLDDNTNVDS
ncbi:15-hydroxyprostaglandin dehydrogenase [NAD(+)]-like [Ylistrum balloti]|uniref:15-hydroxyprostaglandin dehydrogenase [NAD(+)]-like n=1 Tax=Ylistrum balloti TaxID=509963 RepID=UPI002905C6CE|nr:15-hydroxyprostaglandin dehydrogenase [NAD(+)]-like [Ylistrum balloti]